MPRPPSKKTQSLDAMMRKMTLKKKQSTGRKSAYNPKRKAKMRNARRPFVEQKTRTSEEVSNFMEAVFQGGGGVQLAERPALTMNFAYVPTDDAFTHLENSALTWMLQGQKEDQMIGQAIYANYLKTKIEFQFPAKPYSLPAKLYLVHGFIKHSPNLTNVGTQNLTNFKWSDYKKFIEDNIKPYFDEREDKLRFIPKRNSTIRIDGYKNIVPNLNKTYSVVAQPTGDAGTIIGSIPNKNVSITHKMKRKIHYEFSQAPEASWYTSQTNNSKPPGTWLFPNMNHWTPFTLLYNPQYADNVATTDAERIGIRYNQILYYTDA